MDFRLLEGERLDDLVRDGMRIIQHPDQFCFSIDSILLAHFVRIKKKDRILDLGTGTAVIPLLLTAWGADHITAIEKNPMTADMAARSVAGNHKSKEIHVIEADYCQIKTVFPAGGCFTSVVANPPYRDIGRGALNKAAGVSDACHELTATLADVFAAAQYTLMYGGRLTMVHRADRFGDLLWQGRQHNMEMKRARFVHSHRMDIASRVLAEWRYGGRPGVQVEAPLIIHENDGTYTPEVMEIYGKNDKAESVIC